MDEDTSEYIWHARDGSIPVREMEDNHLRFALRAVLFDAVKRKDAIRPLLNEIKKRGLPLAEDFESEHHAICASAVSAYQSLYERLTAEDQEKVLAHLAWFFHHVEGSPEVAVKVSWWDIVSMDPPEVEELSAAGHLVEMTEELGKHWPHLKEAKDHIRHRLASFLDSVAPEASARIESSFVSSKPKRRLGKKRNRSK